MRCIKCKEENINSANYCKKCGREFTSKEKDIAKSKTFVGKLELLEKAYNVCSLKIITDNIIFKLATLLIVIIFGIMINFNYGNKVKILESPNYKIQYNKNLKEYYLIVNDDQVTLKLYKPNSLKNLSVTHIDENNNKTSMEYTKDDEILLSSNDMDDYYLIKINNKENIKLYIFREDSLYE